MSGRLETLPAQLLELGRGSRAEQDLPFRPSILGQRSPRSGSSRLAAASPSKQLIHTARQPLLLRKHKDNSNSYSSTRSRGYCANHPKREAYFKGNFQGRLQLFCSRCAAQIASQGYRVDRLPTEKSLKRAANNHSEYPRSMEITEFLEQLRSVEKSLHLTNGELITLEYQYRLKLEYLGDFYDSMMEYVQQLKRQHLSLMKQDISRNLQIALVELKQNDENLLEMKSIIHDIESQLDAIVNVIPEDQFRKCINEYQRSLESYRQTAAGQQTFIRNTSDPEINSLRDKLVAFQAAAQNIIGKEESGARAIAGGVFSFDGSANTQPLKSAFRNLFDSGQQESDQEVFTHQSPQFKVI